MNSNSQTLSILPVHSLNLPPTHLPPNSPHWHALTGHACNGGYIQKEIHIILRRCNTHLTANKSVRLVQTLQLKPWPWTRHSQDRKGRKQHVSCGMNNPLLCSWSCWGSQISSRVCCSKPTMWHPKAGLQKDIWSSKVRKKTPSDLWIWFIPNCSGRSLVGGAGRLPTSREHVELKVQHKERSLEMYRDRSRIKP